MSGRCGAASPGSSARSKRSPGGSAAEVGPRELRADVSSALRPDPGRSADRYGHWLDPGQPRGTGRVRRRIEAARGARGSESPPGRGHRATINQRTQSNDNTEVTKATEVHRAILVFRTIASCWNRGDHHAV